MSQTKGWPTRRFHLESRRIWNMYEHTSVAHKIVANTKIARHRLASVPSTACTFRRTVKTMAANSTHACLLPTRSLPTGVRTSSAFSSEDVPRDTPSGVPPSPRRSLPIIVRQTVSRSHAMCSRRCILRYRCAAATSPWVTHFAYRWRRAD